MVPEAPGSRVALASVVPPRLVRTAPVGAASAANAFASHAAPKEELGLVIQTAVRDVESSCATGSRIAGRIVPT